MNKTENNAKCCLEYLQTLESIFGENHHAMSTMLRREAPRHISKDSNSRSFYEHHHCRLDNSKLCPQSQYPVIGRRPTQLKGNLETCVDGKSESSSYSDVETVLVEARRVVCDGINLTVYPERRIRQNGMSSDC